MRFNFAVPALLAVAVAVPVEMAGVSGLGSYRPGLRAGGTFESGLNDEH